jgi:methanogenic corrinoid protein MtbC1
MLLSEGELSMPEKPQKRGGQRPGDSVGSLASQALSLIVSRRTGRGPGMSEVFLDALEDAVLNPEQGARDKVVAEMIAARIPKHEIADLYIPEVARRMGQAWCEDRMSFARVTIGAARLQGLLREMTDGWSMDAPYDDAGPNIVVLVLADEYHTLGPMLITSQLRRLGVSVRLLLGRPLPEVQAILRDRDYDAVFISAAHVEKLAHIAGIVALLRASLQRETPIVIGGAAVEEEPNTKSLTGADHVSNDIREALTLCGLGARITDHSRLAARR